MNKQGQADLFVDELLREMKTNTEDEVRSRHPIAMGEIVGRDCIQMLAATTANIFSKIEPKLRWSETNIGGREWHGHFHGRQIRGVTVARRFGKRVQLDFFLGSFPAQMRQSLRDAGKDIIGNDMWGLPTGHNIEFPPVPIEEVLDAKLPFGLTTDVILTSPVACKPISGRGDVERVCGHSIIVYGGRASGPRLTAGTTTLSLWTGEVAGLPLEVANVIHWADAQHVKAMAMAMHPWPVVALFQARMRARTLSFLDKSYFESGEAE